MGTRGTVNGLSRYDLHLMVGELSVGLKDTRIMGIECGLQPSLSGLLSVRLVVSFPMLRYHFLDRTINYVFVLRIYQILSP